MVPHDFTDAGDAAVKHAVAMAHQADGKVSLLHVVAKDTERDAAIKKLTEIVGQIRKAHPNIKVDAYVEKGSIFTEIGSTADSIEADMIVMGTHGAKGMQKIFGSFAIKVITNANVPFCVVQKGTTPQPIKKIVFAIDLTLESMQIMTMTVDLAKIFDAEIHLVAKRESDPAFARKLSIHFHVAEKQFDQHKVKYVIHYLEGSGGLLKRIIDYSQKEKASMIDISYHSESLLPQFDTFAQNVITNDLKLPALIVNSNAVTSGYF